MIHKLTQTEYVLLKEIDREGISNLAALQHVFYKRICRFFFIDGMRADRWYYRPTMNFCHFVAETYLWLLIEKEMIWLGRYGDVYLTSHGNVSIAVYERRASR